MGINFPENLTPREAIELQKKLRTEVNIVPYQKKPKIIGGCDMSLNRFAKEGFAGFVNLDYETLSVLTHSVVKSDIRFPYIPGLLSFREIPMLIRAWEKLEVKPDVLIVDGVGIAHPRRLGIATHLGLVLGIPTIGCAKSLLTGEYKELGENPGDFSYIYAIQKGAETCTEEIIGAALRTKRGVKPVFISPGNLITLEESLEIVKNCVRKHRLPEPTRLAHRIVNEYRLGIVS